VAQVQRTTRTVTTHVITLNDDEFDLLTDCIAEEIQDGLRKGEICAGYVLALQKLQSELFKR
jgi:hypothetical protein